MERVAPQQQVYYYLPQKGWLRGVVSAVFDQEKKAHVEDITTGQKEVVSLTQLHCCIERAFDPTDPDLFHLNDLHIATTLYCIKHRFEQLKQQYSLMGDMVLSVNPFQLMSFNSDTYREKYLNSKQPQSLPPHIWQVAHKSYMQIVVRGLGNQSIVISGESGSGKTESAKMLIAYFGQLSYMHSSNVMQKGLADKVADNLKWGNVLLESFGNARTVRNDNSSRFSKYIKLYFDTSSGVMVGGEVITYLLEKSRILLQSAGERSYHIFYEFFAGLSAEEKREFGCLKSAHDYKCLNGGNSFERRGVDGKVVDDAERFQSVRRALTAIGVRADEQKSIFRVLAGIIHLLELQFDSDQNDKACFYDETPLNTACELLQVDAGLLRECFLVKSRTNIVTIFSNKAEAEGMRGAFCKAVYVALFDHIVNFVNRSIAPEGSIAEYKYIGLLDIFGFENFAHNSFEQLCINYANESLQNHYNKYTFVNDEEECKREGIDIPKVAFVDNSECLKMFDQKRNGIFALLDEECHFKGGTSERFVHSLWEIWNKANKYFVLPKSTVPNQFGINHYAAFVTYNTDGWLGKNADNLKEEACRCLITSSDLFVQRLLPKSYVVDKRRQTVAFRFREQLEKLREELESTETQFIRCVKPNMEARPDHMDSFIVGCQLESAGVMQTIALKRKGYPVRRFFDQFCHFFRLILPSAAEKHYKANDYRAAAELLLAYYERLYDWEKPNYAIGNSKVFLCAEIWSLLERLVLRRKGWLMRRCVPFLWRWIHAHREAKRLLIESRNEEIRQLKDKNKHGNAEISKDKITLEQVEWVEELATLFPFVDVPTLIDIVVCLPRREDSLAAVTEMQYQCVDGLLMSTFMRVVNEAQLRTVVVQNLVERGINAVEELSKCDQEGLRQYGMTDVEVTAVTRIMLREQSARVKLERLQSSIGTPQLGDVVGEAKQHVAAQTDFGVRLRRLTAMGFSPRHAEVVLTHYSGDVQRAAERLLRGDVSRLVTAQPPGGAKGRWTSLDPQVQRLVRLGATKNEAKRALRHARGNLNKAVQLLFFPQL